MAHPQGQPAPGRNRLLDALPRRDHQRLARKLTPHRFEVRDSVYVPDRPITHVYFPTSGIISYVIRMRDGAAVEVATIGNEGLVGTQVFLEADRSPTEAFCQVPAHSLRLSTSDFLAEVENSRALASVVRRYTQALMNQISQSTACNHLHSIEQRMSRWLLMCQDRVGNDEFPLTQEFLAQMLGVRRASVTVAAGILQRELLISYHRGRMTILDRQGLESRACECYAVVRRELDRLLT